MLIQSNANSMLIRRYSEVKANKKKLGVTKGFHDKSLDEGI